MIAIKPQGKELAKILHHFDLLEDSDKYKVVCPFHDDVNASMLINLDEGDFFCFGCAATGDAMDFVKLRYPKHDDLSNLIKYFRLINSKKVKSLEFRKFEGKSTKRSNEALEQHLDEAHDYYYGLRTIDWDWPEGIEELHVRDYMNGRGFTNRTLNVCKAKYTYSKNYPIIFPMLDNGKFKGWVTRTMTKEIEAKRKYLYNKGFSRRDTLVGDYKGKKVVVLVEGYMDRLKMIQFGATSVVAILGWKITAEQITKLKDAGVETIISALDNDSCGRKGSEFLRKHFEVIRFKFPKGVKDPGEMNIKQFERSNAETLKIYRRLENEKRKLSQRHQEPDQQKRK